MYKLLKVAPRKAVLITDALTRKFLTDIELAEGFLLLCKSPAYFADARYFSAVKDKISDKGLTPVLYNGLSDIKNYMQGLGVTELLVDFERTTVAEFNSYKALCDDISDCSEGLKGLRAVKTDAQLDLIIKACQIAQDSFYYAIERVKEGMTEIELAAIIEGKMLGLGAEGASFETIVAFGENAAVPHHVTGEATLKKGQPILVDMGAKYKGYCSDLTRTVFFGTPSDGFINDYNAVLSANITAEQNITSGISGRVADGFARQVLEQRGLGKYFTHSLGHGVGLEIHEYPALSPKKDDELFDGMVFTVEPGVYKDGEYGIRIEDTVCLKNGKIVRLFTDGKELKIIK